MRSKIDGIDVWDDLNDVLNCQIPYIAVNKLFLQFSMFMKYMFLSITDSVMISHI